MNIKYVLIYLMAVTAGFNLSCRKDNGHVKPPVVVYPPREILYQVTGSKLSINFIDSTSVFQSEVPFDQTFYYKFKRGPGTSVGMSVNIQDSTGHIESWEIYVDGKLFANAFSVGGAYFEIPYR